MKPCYNKKMKNFKDGFSDFKKKSNDFGGRPKFGQGRGGNGGGSFDRGPKFGGRSSGQELFAAVCSTCGKSCEVPFRPNGEKPVYCSACFGKSRDDNAREERGGDRNEGFRNNNRTESTPYQKPERQYQAPASNTNVERELDAVKQQLAKIELQLNRILGFVNPPVAKVTKEVVEVKAGVAEAEVVPKKERKPKTVKVKKVAEKKVAKKAVKKAVKKAK